MYFCFYLPFNCECVCIYAVFLSVTKQLNNYSSHYPKQHPKLKSCSLSVQTGRLFNNINSINPIYTQQPSEAPFFVLLQASSTKCNTFAHRLTLFFCLFYKQARFTRFSVALLLQHLTSVLWVSAFLSFFRSEMKVVSYL